MGCWVCSRIPPQPGEACKCCAYVARRPDPNMPVFIVRHCNKTACLREVSRAAKLQFIGMDINPTVIAAAPTQRKNMTAEDIFMRPVKRRVQHVQKADVSVPVQRLYRFKETVRLLGTIPGKDQWFNENQRVIRMMIATHMKIIVGEKEFKDAQLELYQLLDTEDFSMIAFIIWVTSRQQGKTTALAQ